jgi:hypothetical protein
MSKVKAVLVLSLALATGLAPGTSAETRKEVPAKQFERGGTWRFWFGNGYRKAWTTAAELPVIDLKTEAGGLTPVREVGGLQTVGLALKGANGSLFTFRKLMKEPERTIPKAWLGTEVEGVVKDQTSAAHPAATVVVGALARSVGILFYGSRVMVMPDDPILGKFAKTFANTVGTFDEYPAPGYRGITEIVSTKDLWKKWLLGGPENRVDSRAFVKARLFDLTVGNWDRHSGQWRWARVADQPLWEPVPEDADQAFTHYEGRFVASARNLIPRFMRYSGEFPGRIEGLTVNNADVTRWFPADLEWPAFEEVARGLQSELTDAVIDEAIRQMPAEWYAIDGAQMTKDLKQRRDHLVDYARKFYLHLADRVEVRATDRDDVASVEHFEDGALRVTLAPANPDGSAGLPYYQRRFLPKETKEVRVYLYGGNDHLVTSGPKKGDITLRVLGGTGNDVLDDSKSGNADLRDSEGKNTFERGPGTQVDEHPWKNPAPNPDKPWLEPRGYGHWTSPVFMVYWEPDQAFMLGGGFNRTSWGFRDYPWKSMQGATVLYSTGYTSVRASYFGEVRLRESALTARVDLMASGIEDLNYFGMGNETPKLEKEQFKTEESTYTAFPTLRYTPGRKFQVHAGVEFKGLQEKGQGQTLVEQDQPYGSGNFNELTVRTGFEYDTRGRALGFLAQPMATTDPGAAASGPKISGIRVLADGLYAPKVWDVADAFGRVEGSLSGYLGNQRIVFSARVGGAKLWGPYPYFESASLGGSDNVRGWDRSRFRGDSSLFGNTELRLWIGHRKKPLLPVRWGLLGFFDVGRVWLAGENSDTWHTGYGGGLLGEVLGLPGLAVRGTLAWSPDGDVHVYVGSGYSF